MLDRIPRWIVQTVGTAVVLLATASNRLGSGHDYALAGFALAASATVFLSRWRPVAVLAFLTDRKSTRPELQSHSDLVCRLLLEKKKKKLNDRVVQVNIDQGNEKFFLAALPFVARIRHRIVNQVIHTIANSANPNAQGKSEDGT